ncbi:MAG: PLP-dependent aspartate aminotransferase family protein [Myxococcota bacterium]
MTVPPRQSGHGGPPLPSSTTTSSPGGSCEAPPRGETAGPAPATRVVHAGRLPDPTTGAIVPPIVLSTTFARDEKGNLRGPHLYGRHGNPTRARLEACLAELEGAEDALAFASGCAAAQALLSTVHRGETVVLGHDLYFGIRAQYRRLAPRFGIELVEMNLTTAASLDALEGRAVRFVFAESPTNPRLALVDIEALAARCHRLGAELVIDNTVATPLLQSPLALGADWVLHATTKYLSGHSDVVGGALVGGAAAGAGHEHDTLGALRDIQRLGGAVPSPFDCYLLLRGIATLDVRLQRQVDNAEQLATWLDQHPAVRTVHYPGLTTHPQHDLVRRQMRRPGALLSMRLAGGADAARRFCGRVALAVPATSLGGVHTLVEHRHPVEGPESRTPEDLVRVSVGIEAIDDLLEDFRAALS